MEVAFAASFFVAVVCFLIRPIKKLSEKLSETAARQQSQEIFTQFSEIIRVRPDAFGFLAEKLEGPEPWSFSTSKLISFDDLPVESDSEVLGSFQVEVSWSQAPLGDSPYAVLNVVISKSGSPNEVFYQNKVVCLR